MREPAERVEESTRWLRWPSPYELTSLMVAFAALIVSYSSYRVSREAEDAQKENVLIICDIAEKEKVKFLSDTETGIPWRIKIAWIARINNNSRGPLTIEKMSVNTTSPGSTGWGNHHDTPGSYTDNQYGAEHSINAQDIYLEMGKEIHVGFDTALGVSDTVAKLPGMSDADTFEKINDVENANQTWGLFGTREIRPYVNITVVTGRGKYFQSECHLPIF